MPNPFFPDAWPYPQQIDDRAYALGGLGAARRDALNFAQQVNSGRSTQDLLDVGRAAQARRDAAERARIAQARSRLFAPLRSGLPPGAAQGWKHFPMQVGSNLAGLSALDGAEQGFSVVGSALGALASLFVGYHVIKSHSLPTSVKVLSGVAAVGGLLQFVLVLVAPAETAAPSLNTPFKPTTL